MRGLLNIDDEYVSLARENGAKIAIKNEHEKPVSEALRNRGFFV